MDTVCAAAAAATAAAAAATAAAAAATATAAAAAAYSALAALVGMCTSAISSSVHMLRWLLQDDFCSGCVHCCRRSWVSW